MSTNRLRNPSILGSESILSFGDDSSVGESTVGRLEKTSSIVRPRENIFVNRAKCLVFAVLCVAAMIASGTTYLVTRRAENTRFEDTFLIVAEDVMDSSFDNLRNAQTAFDAFSMGITSASIGSGTTWPYFTITNWGPQASQLSMQTGSKRVGFVPLVANERRPAWEAYSVEYQGWVQETLDWGYPSKGFIISSIEPVIWRNTSLVDNSPTPEDRVFDSYLAPLWQTSPITPNAADNFQINRNMLEVDSLGSLLKYSVENKTSILSEPLNILPEETVNLESAYSVIISPVLGESLQTTTDESNVVAVLYGLIDWVTIFSDIVSENVATIVVVVENTCTDTFTMQIDGPVVTYRGEGDSHDRQYDEYALSAALEGVPTTENCVTTISLYPTTRFREFSVAKSAWLFSGIILLVFFSAGVGFVVYDWTVTRRSESIEARAAKTDALVNSLFPANVKDRLIGERENGEDDHNINVSEFGAALMEAQKPAVKNSGGQPDALETDASGVFTTKPIADLFPAATVMFADIAGFTAWSSTREPSQVFILLETTYNAFDKLARRRRVFKVETIGDCYVAAAGLPDPRPDHAVVMARFANDCLIRMKNVVQKLEVTLGPDTAELSMRIGLHSGPVTAGVLRGEKSRFQLFGDTVNTTSRIESTGEKDKIHVSMETAECLKKYGKGHWVQKRDELVQAKGKGEMQTFWLVVGHPMSLNKNASMLDVSLHVPEDNSEHSSEEEKKTTTRVRPIEQISKKIMDGKMQRLIGWNVDVLKRQLRQVLAMRDPRKIPTRLATIASDGDEMGSRQTAPSFL